MTTPALSGLAYLARRYCFTSVSYTHLKVIVSNFVKLEVKKDDVKKALIITPYFTVKTGAKLANAYYVCLLYTSRCV